jgi:hypothetical protein
MANEYGVYVSVRNSDGALLSSFRATWGEVRADLAEALGESAAEEIIDSLAGVKAVPKKSSLGSTAESIVIEQLDAEVMDDTAPAVPVVAQDITPQFERCSVCGGLKDKWVPPGTSKAGKPYPGFWGCSSLKNHPPR